jgi:tRNA(adenine34) deaminase
MTSITAQTHTSYMQMAIRQAEIARENDEVPAGCIIIQLPNPENAEITSPRIVGKAHNQVELLKDPTAHAEMIAITQATSATGDWRLTNTVLYVTKEPCAMCAGAIVLARIPTVVFGVPDPKRGGAVSAFNILNNEHLIHKCEVISGILEDECRSLLQDFFRKKREKPQN